MRWNLKKQAGRLRFFADENISIRLVEVLRAYAESGCVIDVLQDKFEQGTQDDDWITELGKWHPKPIVLSGDGRILTNPARLAALQDARLSFVVFAAGFPHLSWKEQVLKTIKVWDEIYAKVPAERKPTVFKVTIQGKLEKVRLLADYRGQSTADKRRLDRDQSA